MVDTDAMAPELLKLIAFFGLPVLGLAYMVILTIVRDRRRRRAWDGLGEKLGGELSWQGKWSKDDVGLRRLKLQGRYRDRDIALTAHLGLSAPTPDCPVVGACKLSLDNQSMKPFSLLCRWDSSSIDQGFKGLGYALHLVVVFLNTFTRIFGEKRRSRAHDPMALNLRLGSNPDVPPIDVAGLPIGEGTVLFGEPIGAVKALVSRPEVADALRAFMGPRQSGLALINAPDRNGDVRVQVTMGEIRVASNKKIPPDQWRVPADLLVVLAQAVEQADAEEIGE